MRPMNEDRRELLEDIFAPEHQAKCVTAEEITRIVHAARQARQRRRRSAAGAALILAAALSAVALFPRKPGSVPPTAANVPAAPVIALAQAPAMPPAVEHVDDEGMLAMLDDKPAALVRWPDGRRSLLLLVANPPAK